MGFDGLFKHALGDLEGSSPGQFQHPWDMAGKLSRKEDAL